MYLAIWPDGTTYKAQSDGKTQWPLLLAENIARTIDGTVQAA
jgi:hypothetical protein